VMSLVVGRRKRKMRERYFRFLGVTFYRITFRSESYLNVVIMFWFGLMLGLFVGTVLREIV